jgi:outer membrane protein assembly factor BamB
MRVYVSYATEDSALAEELLAALDAWQISYALPDGAEPAPLPACEVVLRLVTPAARSSQRMQEAWQAATLAEPLPNLIELSFVPATPRMERAPLALRIDATGERRQWLQRLAQTLGVTVSIQAAIGAGPAAPEPPRRAFSSRHEPDLTTHPAFGWRVHAGQQVTPTPTLLGDETLVLCTDVGVLAVRAADGSILWRNPEVRVEHAPIGPAFAVGADALYVVAGGQLCALERAGGTLLWSVPVAPCVGRQPLLAGGVVYAATDAGDAAAVAARDGALLWRRQISRVPKYLTVPVAAGDLLILGAGDSVLYAVQRSDGAPVWERLVGGPIYRPPVVHGTVLYVTAFHADLHALDARTGAVLWAVDAGQGSSDATLADGALYLGSVVTGAVSAVQAADGSVLWQVRPGGAIYEAPAITSTTVYVMAGLSLYALDRQHGTERWSTRRPGNANTSAMLLHAGMLYFGAQDGYLYALQVDDERGNGNGH